MTNGEIWAIATPVGIALAAGLVGYGGLRRASGSHTRGIKDLYDKKAEAEILRRLETRIEGIDKWSREHDEKSNAVRRQIGERFAQIEKAVETGTNHHEEVMRMVTRLEVFIEKMEREFKDKFEKVEDAIERRNAP